MLFAAWAPEHAQNVCTMFLCVSFRSNSSNVHWQNAFEFVDSIRFFSLLLLLLLLLLLILSNVLQVQGCLGYSVATVALDHVDVQARLPGSVKDFRPPLFEQNKVPVFLDIPHSSPSTRCWNTQRYTKILLLHKRLLQGKTKENPCTSRSLNINLLRRNPCWIKKCHFNPVT